MEMAQNLCHRCSSPLPEGALFCTECGAPQLVLTETDAQRVADERAATSADGSVPLPRATAMGRIRWRPVLRIVIGVSLVVGVFMGLGNLAPGFGLVAWFLVIAAPMLTLNLYQRQVPGAFMDAGIGTRIGMMMGLLMGFIVVAAYSAGEVIYRYPLHQGALMDQQLNELLQKMAAYPAFAAANAAGPPPFLAIYQTPDGRAGAALASGVMLWGFVLVYCMLSGALRGWVRPMPPRNRPA
jgi:hypothetical protein